MPQPAMQLHAHRVRAALELPRDLFGALAFGQVDAKHAWIRLGNAIERLLERSHELAKLNVGLRVLGPFASDPRRIGHPAVPRPRRTHLVREDPEEPRKELARCIESLRMLDRREECRL